MFPRENKVPCSKIYIGSLKRISFYKFNFNVHLRQITRSRSKLNQKYESLPHTLQVGACQTGTLWSIEQWKTILYSSPVVDQRKYLDFEIEQQQPISVTIELRHEKSSLSPQRKEQRGRGPTTTETTTGNTRMRQESK